MTNPLIIDTFNRRAWIHFDGSISAHSQFATAEPADNVAAVVRFDRLVPHENDEIHLDLDAFIPHLVETWGAALAARDAEALGDLGDWVLSEINNYQRADALPPN